VLRVGEGAESAEVAFTGEVALLGVGCVVSSVVAVTTTVT
jgi:hypothetical protein